MRETVYKKMYTTLFNAVTDALERINACMGEAIPWAPGLPLRGDGYETPFYMKD